MSRFAECDDEEAVEDFDKELRAAYRAAGVKADLRGFLAYLDAMPVKRIIDSRFMEPKTGEMCAVATYCAHKGFEKKKLLKIEGQSFRERYENGQGGDMGAEDNDGWDGATVAAGQEAGLSHAIAYDLAWMNDMVWDTVIERDPVGCDERCELIKKPGYGLPMRREDRYGLCPNQHTISRAMTPEERWQKLRDYVAAKTGKVT